MIPFSVRLEHLYRNIRNGALGILAEFALVVFIMLAGFAVCLFWWGLFR
jgi:hypothetical protein